MRVDPPTRYNPSRSIKAESPSSNFADGSSLRLWTGCSVAIDLKELACSAIPVKGCCSENPLRFLEIFGNDNRVPSGMPDERQVNGWAALTHAFYPRIPGVRFSIGPQHFQPPYCWRDVAPYYICRSFTYNTNAFHRILLNLRDRGSIAANDVPLLLDQACRILSYLYRARDSFILKNINNNINMYFLSKTIEFVVGKAVYDSECQELDLISQSLEISLERSQSFSRLSTIDKMGLAVGRGVSFVEERICRKNAETSATEQVDKDAFAYFGRALAIDHRERLLATIENGCLSKGRFRLVAIVDDTTETVADLWWIADLLFIFPFLTIDLLVNVAQISINFSSHIVNAVFAHPSFRKLADVCGTRLHVVHTYSPFISFQTNFLMQEARSLIARADAVFVKGANFFETLQLFDKSTYYAFVVYGPVSRALSGLNDFDAVWAQVPAGRVGYEYSPNRGVTRTLLQTVGQPRTQL